MSMDVISRYQRKIRCACPVKGAKVPMRLDDFAIGPTADGHHMELQASFKTHSIEGTKPCVRTTGMRYTEY